MTNLTFDASPDEQPEDSPVAASLLWLFIGMSFIAAPLFLLF